MKYIHNSIKSDTLFSRRRDELQHSSCRTNKESNNASTLKEFPGHEALFKFLQSELFSTSDDVAKDRLPKLSINSLELLPMNKFSKVFNLFTAESSLCKRKTCFK